MQNNTIVITVSSGTGKSCVISNLESKGHYCFHNEIYGTDNELYQSFEQAQNIYECLKKAYITFGYQLNKVPKQSIETRSHFILNTLES